MENSKENNEVLQPIRNYRVGIGRFRYQYWDEKKKKKISLTSDNFKRYELADKYKRMLGVILTSSRNFK